MPSGDLMLGRLIKKSNPPKFRVFSTFRYVFNQTWLVLHDFNSLQNPGRISECPGNVWRYAILN
jgi:hypothetical protein